LSSLRDKISDVLKFVADAVAGECVEDSQKFSGAGDEGDLLGFAAGEKVFVFCFNDGVGADRADGTEVEDVADGGSSAAASRRRSRWSPA